MNIIITLAGLAGIIASFMVLKVLVQFSTKVLAANWFRHHASTITNIQKNATTALFIVCLSLCVLLISINGVLILQGKNVLNFYVALLGSIPQKFWIQLAIALFKCTSLLVLVKFSLPYFITALDQACVLAQNSDQITANDKSVQVFFNTLKKVSGTSIYLLALIFCGEFLGIPHLIIKYLNIGLKAYLAVSLGQLIIKLLSVMITTLDAFLQQSNHESILHHYERFRHLVPVLKKALEYILYIGLTTLVIQDIEFIAWITTYSDEIVQIIGLYFLCGVFMEIFNIILEDLVLKTDHLTDLQRQRRLTIIPLFKSVFKYVTYFVSGIIVLKLIGIDPAPILAGAGIVGLAVGFGAQNLINDIVCGFFILFENYYLVGDYIKAGKEEERVVEGVVEAIELRTTHVRHPDGQLQIIRNGEIGSIVNYSKQYAYANVDVSVPEGLELEQVYELIKQIGKNLERECSDVLEPTQIEGLESLEANNLVIRTMTRVKPGKHLHVPRLLRSKLKAAFDEQLAQKSLTKIGLESE